MTGTDLRLALPPNPSQAIHASEISARQHPFNAAEYIQLNHFYTIFHTTMTDVKSAIKADWAADEDDNGALPLLLLPEIAELG
jgi:hypothetical protein